MLTVDRCPVLCCCTKARLQPQYSYSYTAAGQLSPPSLCALHASVARCSEDAELRDIDGMPLHD
jgi:hypothetical protein